MKTNARSLSALASALLLAVSAAIVSGCVTPSHRIRELRNRAVAVNVIIVYNPATKMGEFLAPSDKTIELSEKYRDYAEWVSPDGLVYVTFSKESPFDGPPKHEKKVLKSGPPKRGTAWNEFEYTAELELFDPPHTRVPVVDPRIVIAP